MRFPASCPIHIVMLGCGGTGGHIAPHLYRLLYSVCLLYTSRCV